MSMLNDAQSDGATTAETKTSAAATEHGTMSMLNEAQADGEAEAETKTSAAATEHGTISMLKEEEQECELNATLFSSWQYWDADWTKEAIDSGTKHSLALNNALQAVFSNIRPNSMAEQHENAKREGLSQWLENDYAIWKNKVVANLDHMHTKGVPKRIILDSMRLESDEGRLHKHFLDYINKKIEEGGYDHEMPEPTVVDWLMVKLFDRTYRRKEEQQERAAKARRTGINKKMLVPKIPATCSGSSRRTDHNRTQKRKHE